MSSLQNGDTEVSVEPTSTVDDEENYTHSRRQQALEDAREHALDVRTDARGQYIEGYIDSRAQLEYYRGAVEGYVLQAAPILERTELALSEDYLEGFPLGSITFEPPQELVDIGRDNIGRLAPGAQIPTPTSFDVIGLQDILQLPSPLSTEFGVTLLRNGDEDEHTATVTAELPQTVLDRALQVTDMALAEADIGVQLSDDEQTKKITMDMIREVDEWRQTNIQTEE